MKKLFALMISVIIIVSLMGCSDTPSNAQNTPTAGDTTSSIVAFPENRMERVGRSNDGSTTHFYYYRDIYTDVVYVFAYYPVVYGGGGSLTPLLKSDGTPYLWSEIEQGGE